LRDLTITLPFNDFEQLERAFKDQGHTIAAVITEPMLGNCASIEPEPGFLQHIRNLCNQYGSVFILDEVKTGFRVARGGAQELYGIDPDLATYAKSMGAGYPVAAFGGKREIMSIIGRGVAHAGTYTGNSVGVAAAEKTLEIIATTDALAKMEHRGRKLMDGVQGILESCGVPYQMTGHPNMFAFVLLDRKAKGYRDWAVSDHETYEAVMRAMIVRGVMPDPDSREPWFMSTAHSDGDVSETLTVFEDAMKEVLAHRR
jgi:glutamate-1-semialdehyde 2,1-aminomutase